MSNTNRSGATLGCSKQEKKTAEAGCYTGSVEQIKLILQMEAVAVHANNRQNALIQAFAT